MSRVYDWTEVSTQFVGKVANGVAYRYRQYGVTAEDVTQEIQVWLLGPGKKKVERWLANSPQQTTRIFMSMTGKAQRYAEKEKANKCGYDVDDVMWYSPSTVEGLMPLALDDTFTGEVTVDDGASGRRQSKPVNEGGDLLAMVMDVRRAIAARKLTEFFYHHNDSHPNWDAHIEELVSFLGGDRPYTGRRKSLGNAQAQAITANLESA